MDETNSEGIFMKSNAAPSSDYSSMFSKNIVIVILVTLLVLSFLGINLLLVFGNAMNGVTQIFGPFVNTLLANLGFATGTVINKTTDVVVDTTKTGVDITGGAVHDIGNLFIGGSQQLANVAPPMMSNIMNRRTPDADATSNPIQKPITAGKSQWCLVGEYQGKRGCIEVSDADKCLSGQVYPQQKMCLNPTLTPNV
jgi:hypothetical protein